MNENRFPHAYSTVLAELTRRLEEPAPARIQILSGPRQVGKTHLLGEIETLFGDRVVYAAADAPASALPGWWEARWREAERIAGAGKAAILVIDEIQYLPRWGRLLKSAHDAVVRRRVPIHVVVSGSSSLQLGRGARESMAGRFERLRLLHWPVSEFARVFSFEEEEALRISVRFGTFPGAVPFLSQPDRWRRYVLDAIVEPAIGRDVLALETIRKPGLLRQVFTVAAGHPAEIISLQKLRGRLDDPGALETIAGYLHVLEQSYLIASLEKVSDNAVRRRRAPPKLVVLNQGILGALSDEVPSTGQMAAATFDRWVENACLAHAWNAGQEVRYWRSEPHEVDMVISGSWGKWAVEIKTGTYGLRRLAGLLEFCRRFPEYRPLLLCDRGDEGVARDAGISCLSWKRFLLSGTPT